MGLSWLPAKLKNSIAIIVGAISIIGLILGIPSSIITIGGFNMTSFWGNLFGNYPTTFPMAVAALNTVITFYLIYWGLARRRERDKAIGRASEIQAIADYETESKEILEMAHNKLRSEHRELEKRYGNLKSMYEKETHTQLTSAKIGAISSVEASATVTQFIKPQELQSLSYKEVYDLYKKR